MGKCTICNGPAKPRADNPDHPFCSARCKMIDLGKWLNEEYRVPAEDLDEDAEELVDVGTKAPDDVRH